MGVNCCAIVRATSLRNTSPTTIPRTPPSGLVKAVIRPTFSGMAPLANCPATSPNNLVHVVSCQKGFQMLSGHPGRTYRCTSSCSAQVLQQQIDVEVESAPPVQPPKRKDLSGSSPLGVCGSRPATTSEFSNSPERSQLPPMLAAQKTIAQADRGRTRVWPSVQLCPSAPFSVDNLLLHRCTDNSRDVSNNWTPMSLQKLVNSFVQLCLRHKSTPVRSVQQDPRQQKKKFPPTDLSCEIPAVLTSSNLL